MEWVDLLQKIGFPAFVAGWFMFRLEKRLDRMIELQSTLMQAIAVLAKSLDNNGRSRRPRVELPGETIPPQQLPSKEGKES